MPIASSPAVLAAATPCAFGAWSILSFSSATFASSSLTFAAFSFAVKLGSLLISSFSVAAAVSKAAFAFSFTLSKSPSLWNPAIAFSPAFLASATWSAFVISAASILPFSSANFVASSLTLSAFSVSVKLPSLLISAVSFSAAFSNAVLAASLTAWRFPGLCTFETSISPVVLAAATSSASVAALIFPLASVNFASSSFVCAAFSFAVKPGSVSIFSFSLAAAASIAAAASLLAASKSPGTCTALTAVSAASFVVANVSAVCAPSIRPFCLVTSSCNAWSCFVLSAEVRVPSFSILDFSTAAIASNWDLAFSFAASKFPGVWTSAIAVSPVLLTTSTTSIVFTASTFACSATLTLSTSAILSSISFEVKLVSLRISAFSLSAAASKAAFATLLASSNVPGLWTALTVSTPAFLASSTPVASVAASTFAFSSSLTTSTRATLVAFSSFVKLPSFSISAFSAFAASSIASFAFAFRTSKLPATPRSFSLVKFVKALDVWAETMLLSFTWAAFNVTFPVATSTGTSWSELDHVPSAAFVNVTVLEAPSSAV